MADRSSLTSLLCAYREPLAAHSLLFVPVHSDTSALLGDHTMADKREQHRRPNKLAIFAAVGATATAAGTALYAMKPGGERGKTAGALLFALGVSAIVGTAVGLRKDTALHKQAMQVRKQPHKTGSKCAAYVSASDPTRFADGLLSLHLLCAGDPRAPRPPSTLR